MVNGGLIEAKGPGYAGLLNSPGVAESVQQKLLQQAVSQVKAANGASITWNVAEESVASAIRSLLQKQGIKGIKVVYTPPK